MSTLITLMLCSKINKRDCALNYQPGVQMLARCCALYMKDTLMILYYFIYYEIKQEVNDITTLHKSEVRSITIGKNHVLQHQLC